MTPAQFAALSADEFAAITKSQSVAITNAQIQALSGLQIGSLKGDQVSALDPSIIGALGAQKFALLSIGAISSLTEIELASAECVKLFETSFAKECYAAMGSGGLMKTVGARAGGSGVPFTKRDGLRAYAA